MRCFAHDDPEADETYGIETREVKGENHGLYGKERKEEVKEKISAKLTNREFSRESIRLMSRAQEGNSIPEVVRDKISESLRGVPKSEETRRRMSQAKLGRDVDWTKKHWTRAAYGGKFRPAKRDAPDRDEVCQVCRHDGSEVSLVVHHIIPVRMFRDAPSFDYRDAHCLGNLLLLCKSCHPKVEWGDTKIAPNFHTVPPHQRSEFGGLWLEYLRQNSPVEENR